MAATIPVFLKHTFINKAAQEKPYTARAHSRYIQRQSATHSVHTFLMPDNYKARQRWFFDHENGLRKNGRVIDKFTITIPYAISQVHAEQTLMEFGKWLGQERCPFMFTLQGFDSRNHHAHFVFVDRDYETGRRVYGTTEMNSTRGIKLEWETSANNMFAALGYDVQVKVHEGYQAENDNHIVDRHELVDAPISIDAEVASDARESEETDTDNVVEDDDMADIHGTLEYPHDADISTAGNLVRMVHTNATELARLREGRERIIAAERRVEWLLSQKETTRTEADKHAEVKLDLEQKAAAASYHLGQYQKDNGKLRGIGISLFGFAIKTSTRQKAEAAQHEAHTRAAEAAQAVRDQRSLEVRISQLDREAAAVAQEAVMNMNELVGVNGTMEELASAESLFLADIDRRIRGNEKEDGIDPKEAWQAWEAGEVTDDELRAYCLHSGNQNMLDELDQNLGQDEGGMSL